MTRGRATVSDAGALSISFGFVDERSGGDSDGIDRDPSSGPATSLVAVLPPSAGQPPDTTPAVDAAVESLLVAAGLTSVAPRPSALVVGPDGTAVAVGDGHDEAVTIGRDWEQVDVVCTDPSVSRRHVRVRLGGAGEPVVEDLASSNGTWVDRRGQRLAVSPGRAVALEHGDVLTTVDGLVLAHIRMEATS